MHYLSPDDQTIHYLESDAFTPLLPPGSVPISDAEAEAMRRPSIATLRATQAALINAACESAIAAIRAGYPESEVLSWPKQEAEARAFVADAAAATPLLDALAAARDIAKAELAARVIAKADAFAALSGQLIGRRQRLIDQLDALGEDATAEDVESIRWQP